MHPLITEELAAFDEEFSGSIGIKTHHAPIELVHASRDEIKQFFTQSLSRVLSKLVAEVETAVIPWNTELKKSEQVRANRESFNAGRAATLDAMREVIGKV